MAHIFMIKKILIRPAWWLTSVIPALWEAEAGRSPEVTSSRQAWPTWWNPVSTKNTKISWAWWWVPVIQATLEAEAGDHAVALQPGDRARHNIKKNNNNYSWVSHYICEELRLDTSNPGSHWLSLCFSACNWCLRIASRTLQMFQPVKIQWVTQSSTFTLQHVQW